MRKKTFLITAFACVCFAVTSCKQNAGTPASEDNSAKSDTTEVQFANNEEAEVAVDSNKAETEVSLRDLLDDGNDNISNPTWKKRLVKLVGQANYDFMLEQYMGTGTETEEGMMGRYMSYTFGGTTRENWEDGYTVTYSCGDGHESLEVKITRNGKTKTFEETK